MKFSIVIPTWNNIGYLRLCIESIRKNSAEEHQIIIHINDGSDGTLEYVKANGLAHTHSDQNTGICYGLNLASLKADHNYLVYMNDDMYVCPEWDKYLSEKIDFIGHNNFMLSGTMIEPEDTGNSSVSVKDFGRDLAEFRESELLETYRDYSKKDWSGSTWPPALVPTELWHKVGGYSTEFSPGMYSDPDFSMKLWHAGCRTFCGCGRSLVYHFQCKTTGKIKKNNGRAQFIRKWGMPPSLFLDKYLKRGTMYSGELPEPELRLRHKAKSALARFQNIFSL